MSGTRAATDTRAVLFDFGGTLYDYRDLERASYEGLRAFVEWQAIEVDDAALVTAYRQALRRVFHRYLPRPFYHHRDMFRDALVELATQLGHALDDEACARHQELQWRLQARDFRLRPGVVDTLRELRRRGLHVGMVSNIDQDHLEHLIEVAGIRDHFHSLLSSEAAGSCKPDQAFFRQALERAGCDAGAAIFVGDSLSQDIAGANRAGMRSVLIWSGEGEPPEENERPAHVIRSIPEVLALLR